MEPRFDNLFDLQINGFGGVDFQKPPGLAAIRHACQQLHACGMRRVLATFITDQSDALLHKFEAFEAYRAADPFIAQTLVGYHLEGPYLSAEPGFRGAHPAHHMKDPDLAEFRRFQEAAGGALRLLTLAPERNDADALIAHATQSGVRVALGHTNADDAQIDTAIRAGATLCTHLGNGCPALLHRHDNIIQRLLARDELIACLIPDGIHLPPSVFQNLFRAKPPGKVILTTDAMAAANAGPGRYPLGDTELEVGADGVVRLPGSPLFAGSALRLDHGIQMAANWLRLPPETVREMASTIPAQALGFPAHSVSGPTHS
jgi:N-acetylglucosamine-6-phosphate deacetylase